MELTIDSVNSAGTKIIIQEKGRYRFSIIEGAYTIYEKEQNKGWLTLISIFINKPLEFEDKGYGPYPINEDATIGFAEMILNYDEAESLSKGSSIVRNLNQDDYVILAVPDSYYEDNSGTIKIKIEKVMNDIVKGGASPLAITSLITGILWFIPGCSPAAIICGIIDLVKISKKESSPAGKGMDIAGIVLAVVMPIILWLIISASVWALIWRASALGSIVN